MRRIKSGGGFFLSLLINMLLNLDGLIPAVILLVLHFVFDWSIVWVFLAVAVWLVWLILMMLILGWARTCGDIPDLPKENKNPYSVGNKKE